MTRFFYSPNRLFAPSETSLLMTRHQPRSGVNRRTELARAFMRSSGILLARIILPIRSWYPRLVSEIVPARTGLCQRKLSVKAGSGDLHGDSRDSTSLPPVPDHAHRIVLMRHGESAFNNANVFTGWCDVALTQRGLVEAVEAGEVFASHHLTFRKCYSSLLTRSIVTAQRSLEAAGISYTPMEYDWRWNERHYGALQGLSKERTADRLGKTLVMKWRRSYEGRPPVMTEDHPHYDIINRDARYKNVDVPTTESLEDCQLRVIEAWDHIAQDAANAVDSDSPYTLVVAHANSLRALVMHLDAISAEEIEGLNIPTAIPFYYDVDKSRGIVLSNKSEESSKRIGHGKFRGIYISDERKKRNFLERRRAANDPWLWALHDEQVARSMLVGDEANDEGALEGMEGLAAEAARNTELFSSSIRQGSDDVLFVHKH